MLKLKKNITNIAVISKAALNKVTNNMRKRAQLRINSHGELFKHQLSNIFFFFFTSDKLE